MFEMLKQQETEMQAYRKATRTGASAAAKFFAYLVAISAIIVLSLIFGQTTSGVFQDPTMKVIGICASFVVGGSSIVFLLFKGKLLKSGTQFKVAWFFLAIEIALLTLGAMHAFGSSLGWQFSPFVNEAAKLAIVLTFPLVMIEWTVVLSLDPDESNDRAENHSKSKLAKTERETHERFRMSDPVIKVRNAAAMTEVINEEMMRLPTNQRKMFATILRTEYGDQFEGVQLFLDDGHLPNVIDQPRQQQPQTTYTVGAEPQLAARPSNLDTIKSQLGKALGLSDQPAQTMASDSPIGPGKYEKELTALESQQGRRDVESAEYREDLRKAGILPDKATEEAVRAKYGPKA